MTNVFGYLTQASTDPNLLLTTVLLPFILIFVILWGALRLTKMFGTDPSANKIYLVISLVITIFAAFTDAWGIVATQLAAISGVFVYIVFFVVFIIGVIMWATGRTRSAYHQHISGTESFDNLKKLDKEIGKRMKKHGELINQGRDAEASSLMETIILLRKKREILLEQTHSHR